jgi:hypothetical protein
MERGAARSPEGRVLRKTRLHPGRIASERLSHQRMVADLPLRGFPPATHREIEPHLGQTQQPAFLDHRCGLLGELDDLGGGMPIVFLLTHRSGVTDSWRDQFDCDRVARNASEPLLFRSNFAKSSLVPIAVQLYGFAQP